MLSGCSPLALAFQLGPLTGSLLLPFLQGGGSDDTELRYSTQYEERLDPFSSFSKRVRGPSHRAAWGAHPTHLASGSLWPPSASPGLTLHPSPTLHLDTPDHQGSPHTPFGSGVAWGPPGWAWHARTTS